MFNEEFHLEQPIRWGMVGGGRGSQIGYIAILHCEIVCLRCVQAPLM